MVVTAIGMRQRTRPGPLPTAEMFAEILHILDMRRAGVSLSCFHQGAATIYRPFSLSG
jgi:hypothetical protein